MKKIRTYIHYSLVCLPLLLLLSACENKMDSIPPIFGPELLIKVLPSAQGEIKFSVRSSQDQMIYVHPWGGYDEIRGYVFEKLISNRYTTWAEPNPVEVTCLFEEEGYGTAEITFDIEAYRHRSKYYAPIIKRVKIKGDYAIASFEANRFDEYTTGQDPAQLELKKLH